MAEADLTWPEDSLERQNDKLRRIAAALMARIEREGQTGSNAYSLFQRSIALEAEVRARTADLQATLAELQAVNGELEQARAEAEAASRAKSRFLAAAGHDLLQPLNAAKLFLGSLTRTPLDGEGARIADNISSALESLETLLGAVLSLSRLDQPSLTANLTAFPLDRVLAPVVREFMPIAAARGGSLSFVPVSARVESDPTYLRQIVQNLISNAVRYTGAGKVLVGCRRRPGAVRIDVCDTGPGIAEEARDEIFREFHRLAAPGDERDPGMGLGLAIVERACRLLGHELELDSTPGFGTRFSVTVPLSTEETGLAEGGALETSLIVIVTRDDGFGTAIGRMIEGWGAGVVAVEDAEAAEEAIRQLGVAPDLVLADEVSLGPARVAALEAVLARACGPGRRLVRVAGERGSRTGAGDDMVIYRPVRPHRLRALLTLPRG